MSVANCKLKIVSDGECKVVALAYIETIMPIPPGYELLVKFGGAVRFYKGRKPRVDEYFPSAVVRS